MSFELNALFSLSIGLGATIGWIRIKRTDPAYLPFLLYLWLGLANEITSIAFMKAGYSNSINYNIFSLAESILLTWQFRKWCLFRGQKRFYFLIQFLFIAGWITETFASGNHHVFNSYFIIGHSFVIVLMSINMVNKVMFEEPAPLFLNPTFLICMGLIIYFTYAILVEAFWMYGLNQSKLFRIHIYTILPYINLFTNLVFAGATLCIPLKRQYILRS
jgi:hypothetical protein